MFQIEVVTTFSIISDIRLYPNLLISFIDETSSCVYKIYTLDHYFMHFVLRLHYICQRPVQYFQARDAGVSHQKWLLVNVQNVLEFSCQILNRDIWSNKAIKTVIKEHFIFWQVRFLSFLCLHTCKHPQFPSSSVLLQYLSDISFLIFNSVCCVMSVFVLN
jgi:hypothetical protein